jgi:hypothetical protein
MKSPAITRRSNILMHIWTRREFLLQLRCFFEGPGGGGRPPCGGAGWIPPQAGPLLPPRGSLISRVVPSVGREAPTLTVLKFTTRVHGIPAADDPKTGSGFPQIPDFSKLPGISVNYLENCLATIKAERAVLRSVGLDCFFMGWLGLTGLLERIGPELSWSALGYSHRAFAVLLCPGSLHAGTGRRPGQPGSLPAPGLSWGQDSPETNVVGVRRVVVVAVGAPRVVGVVVPTAAPHCCSTVLRVEPRGSPPASAEKRGSPPWHACSSRLSKTPAAGWRARRWPP